MFLRLVCVSSSFRFVDVPYLFILLIIDICAVSSFFVIMNKVTTNYFTRLFVAVPFPLVLTSSEITETG